MSLLIFFVWGGKNSKMACQSFRKGEQPEEWAPAQYPDEASRSFSLSASAALVMLQVASTSNRRKSMICWRRPLGQSTSLSSSPCLERSWRVRWRDIKDIGLAVRQNSCGCYFYFSHFIDCVFHLIDNNFWYHAVFFFSSIAWCCAVFRCFVPSILTILSPWCVFPFLRSWSRGDNPERL